MLGAHFDVNLPFLPVSADEPVAGVEELDRMLEVMALGTREGDILDRAVREIELREPLDVVVEVDLRPQHSVDSHTHAPNREVVSQARLRRASGGSDGAVENPGVAAANEEKLVNGLHVTASDAVRNRQGIVRVLLRTLGDLEPAYD